MDRVTLKQICFLLLFFLTASSYKLNAQPDASNALEECNKLIDKGTAAMNKPDYTKALEFFTKAEVLANKYDFEKQLLGIKTNIGIIYTNFSKYGEALSYCLQSLKIARSNPVYKPKIPTILSIIGYIYSKELDYSSSLKYHKEAYALESPGEDKAFHALNISDTYNKLGDIKESQKYLQEVKDIIKTPRNEQLWKVNYAESLYAEGKFSEAQNTMEELLDDVDKQKSSTCYTCIVELLTKIYERQDKLAMAIPLANKGLKNTAVMSEKVGLYDQISKLYYKKRDYETAFKYKDSVIAAKDSLSGAINRGLFESNKVKLKVQEYQNELEAKTSKQRNERILFGIGILSTLMLFFFVYRLQKIRIAKQKQANVIAEKQQQILNLEMENLKNNIAEKNRKLSTKALYLSGRNEIIEEIMDALSQQQVVAQNPEITNYIKTLKNYLKTDAEWDDFINYFEQVNHDFFKALNLKHPQLTPPDIRFLCYIYMNLDIKEISTIFSITSDAARKRKQRIAKKMGVEVDDLHEYILKINEPAA